MFTEKNFKYALKAMNFVKISDEVYQKIFAENISMSVDFNQKKLFYPEKLQNRDKNNQIDSTHKENFVVFECVNRLLDKGYKPENIILEKAWHLGHDSKSGRADICISDLENKTFCIIECKTFGNEYNKALKKLAEDGGQLFSYWQQERACMWLVLYTSTYDEENIVTKSETIDCSDDKNILTAAAKNPEVKTYKNSYTVENLYDTWADTYEKKLLGDLFFSENTAYNVGLKPLKISDLKEFRETDGIINKFEEILRHNNISDYANAFNRLIALFICKLVDETQNAESDNELSFQYKIGSDSYEILQDRLQRLHRDGMEKFMDEKIFYLPDDYAKNLIQQFFGQDRKFMIDDLQSNLRKLKFFTNNDFAFKEVHNEELFYQNGKVLVEMVRLFQNYKIISPQNLQTLGDLFEQLLDKGFKQNEGQFFTPIPITRFIWDSLPLEKISSPPKIIDYACGAGHFLTQGFKAINDFNQNTLPEGWEDRKLFGIEKDYRLARVSRISFFMHGANKGSVIFGDGLENNFDKFIRPGDFDILISNPPYSIKGFKPHLKLENKNFRTLEKVTSEGSEIETLFVERISQLLKSGGIAAVILPSSILNKDGGSFIVAREEILQNFYIRAIVELGSKTFGATGTKTNVIFLEKLNDTPKRFNLLGDSVNQIFRDYLREDWEDKLIFDAWIKKINVDEYIYKKFIHRELDYTDLKNDNYFAEYVAAFENSTDFKNKVKQATFQKLSDAEKISWLNQKFYEFAQEIEREKIQYFAMTYTQKTLIITAPDDNSAQEKFLGYSWSNRKGDEGIKIKSEGGMLYDKNNRRAENKLAYAVRKIFYGEEVEIADAQNLYNYYNLSDLIDFSGVNFTKIIKLTKKIEQTYSGEFPLKKLGEVAPYVTEKISLDEIKISDYVTTDNMLKNKRGIKIFEGEPQISSVTKFLPKDILISNIRPYLKKIWFSDKIGGCSNDILVFRSFDEKILLPEYLFVILSQDYFFDFVMSDVKGLKMPRGDKKNILNFEFPVPTLEEQKKIVLEFAAIDEKISDCEEKINLCEASIKNKFAEMFLDKNFPQKNWEEVLTIQTGKDYKNVQNSEGKFPVYGSGGIIDRANEFICPENSIVIGRKGTINNPIFVREKFWNIDTAFGVIANEKFILPEYLFYFCLQFNFESLNKQLTLPSLARKDLYKILIPVPPKEKQEKFAEYVFLVEEEKKSLNETKKILTAEREKLVKKYFR